MNRPRSRPLRVELLEERACPSAPVPFHDAAGGPPGPPASAPPPHAQLQPDEPAAAPCGPLVQVERAGPQTAARATDVGLPPAADEWGGPPPGDAGALPALHPEPDPLRIVAARGPAVGPHPTAFRGVADGPAPPAATLGNGPPALADTAHVWPAPVDVRPFAAARSSGAPREADVPAAGPVRLAPLPVSQPAAATAERLPPSASAEQPPAPAADGGLPGPRSPGAEVALEDREPSVGLRLPLPAPLAGTLPLDLAAVRDGAREFFGRIADLAAGPERGGWSRLYYLSAGVAVFAAGLAFRAVARQPRRPAPGPALSSFVRSPGVVR